MSTTRRKQAIARSGGDIGRSSWSSAPRRASALKDAAWCVLLQGVGAAGGARQDRNRALAVLG
jgi:hypothetical protein